MENKAAQLRLCGVCEVWRMKIIKSINNNIVSCIDFYVIIGQGRKALKTLGFR